MAETCKCFLLILALSACFQMLFTEGRPIKTTNKQELVSIENETLEDVGKQGMNTNLQHNTAKNKKVSLPSPQITHNPSVHHSLAGRKEMSHPTVPRFTAVSKDDFRPTTPGVSPGVGHPKTLGTNSNNEHSLTDFKDDFQPTAPGHSPGVGHALLDDDDNEDVYPKAPGTGSSIERSGTAFKPTTPGHSPGVGHLFPENNSEDVDPKAPGTSSSSGHSVTTFKPTIPDNSPDIGHTLSEDKIEITAPKSSSIEHSVTGVTDDFRPTVPGHSPGVGHVFQHTNEEQRA